MAKVSLIEYEKALSTLNESLELYRNSGSGSVEQRAFRDTCIQRFEFCVELAWKVSKKVMGTGSTAPKMVIREMALNNFIDNPQLWLSFVDARNISSQTYDEDIAAEVFTVVKMFPQEGVRLLESLKAR